MPLSTKDFHVGSKSTFSNKIVRHEACKVNVGRLAVERVLRKADIDAMLINDGSSTSYVWSEYLDYWLGHHDSRSLRVYTNNLDVPMQFLHDRRTERSKIEVKVAPGEVYLPYYATLGQDTELWMKEYSKRGASLMAVTALDAELGPCGRQEYARAIKGVMLENANYLVVVADHEKMSKPTSEIGYTAANQDAWKKWIERNKSRLWVISTLPSDINPASERALPHPKTPEEWIRRNSAILYQALGEHFVYCYQ
jgi:DeoR/GlpR family transcriptional regulator of sugar metabolism